MALLIVAVVLFFGYANWLSYHPDEARYLHRGSGRFG